MHTSILFACLTSLLFSTRVYAQTKINSRLEADTSRSIIRWKGTKMLKTGGHEGTIKVKSGYLELDGIAIKLGKFVVDMNSIGITDIPPDDQVPIRNLTKHLKEDFETSTFPESTLTIRPGSTFKNTCGSLQIKSVTKNVCIRPQGTPTHFIIELTILRSEYKIGERGSWLERRLVDEEINVRMDIYMN